MSARLATATFLVLALEAAALAQFTPPSFSAWRPYANPSQLVQLGMSKGQVLAIAGEPDREESYYQTAGRGRLLRISDWYYIRTGPNAESTLLKFVGESLVSITSTPIR